MTNLLRTFFATVLMALSLMAPGLPALAGDSGVDQDRMAEKPELAIGRARNDVALKTEAMVATWWKDGGDWAVDLDNGKIEFRNERGWLVTAPVQVIGTYVPAKGTFMWGWDHPSVPEHAALAATAVHDYGKRHGLEKLTTRLVELSEDEAWELTALAGYLHHSTGAYRGTSGSTLVYMTFGAVTIRQP